jgi:hypothetical protein
MMSHTLESGVHCIDTTMIRMTWYVASSQILPLHNSLKVLLTAMAGVSVRNEASVYMRTYPQVYHQDGDLNQSHDALVDDNDGKVYLHNGEFRFQR